MQQQHSEQINTLNPHRSDRSPKGDGHQQSNPGHSLMGLPQCTKAQDKHQVHLQFKHRLLRGA